MNLNIRILPKDEIPNCSLLNQQICFSFGVKCNGLDFTCAVQLALNDAITTGNVFLCLLSLEICNPTPL